MFAGFRNTGCVGVGKVSDQSVVLAELGADVTLRKGKNGEPFRTDEGHWILDGDFGPSITDPAEMARELSTWPGIVEHGLFCGMAERIFLGTDDDVSIIVGTTE